MPFVRSTNSWEKRRKRLKFSRCSSSDGAVDELGAVALDDEGADLAEGVDRGEVDLLVEAGVGALQRVAHEGEDDVGLQPPGDRLGMRLPVHHQLRPAVDGQRVVEEGAAVDAVEQVLDRGAAALRHVDVDERRRRRGPEARGRFRLRPRRAGAAAPLLHRRLSLASGTPVYRRLPDRSNAEARERPRVPFHEQGGMPVLRHEQRTARVFQMLSRGAVLSNGHRHSHATSRRPS